MNLSYIGGQRSFKQSAQRGQSVDIGHREHQRERGGRYNDYFEGEQYGEGRYHRDNYRDYREDRYEKFDRQERQGRKDFGNRGRPQKTMITYVKKGEQEQQPEAHEHQEQPRRQHRQDIHPFKKHISEEHGRKGRFERVIYVKKTKSQNPEDQLEGQSSASHARGRHEGHIEEKENEWQNVEDDETEYKGKVTSSTNNTQSTPLNNTNSSSPNARHYNEHNIHEFFKTIPTTGNFFYLELFIEFLLGLVESNKKEVKREPERTETITQAKQEEKSSPVIPRVENDHVSQTAQKPLLEHPNRQKEKAKTQTEAHEKPIGPNRAQNVHNTHHQTHQTHQGHQTHNAHPSGQNVQNVQTQGSHPEK